MKIAFVASEAAPFVKSGGLGDVASALPKALAAAGHDVKVFVPLYGKIKHDSRYADKLNYMMDFRSMLSWRQQYTGVAKYTESSNPEYYFIDNEYYFDRGGNGIYGQYDDGERFAFFSRAVLDTIGAIGFMPDIVHCNDWQTALVPVLMRRFYPQYNGTRTVFTIHNIEYQGQMPPEFAFDILGLVGGDSQVLSYDGCVNFMKGAIVKSDAVTTVSRTYADEILMEFYSHGLHHVLRDNSHKLYGIVNGIDTETNDPMKDKFLKVNYKDSLEKKKQNKRFLQEKLGLNVDDNAPLVVMISRLVKHKGLDLVERVMDELMGCGIQFAVLGTGENHYEDMFRSTAWRYQGRMAAIINFDLELASQMYAGADMFLMPSLSEPCGLSQLVAMRYGTVPIVRETGGLKDTVPAYNPVEKTGRGFTFVDYNAHEMLRAVRRCADFYYNDRAGFEALQKYDLKGDFSWDTSVKEYEKLYNKLTGR